MPVASTQRVISSAICSGEPTNTGPRPPIATMLGQLAHGPAAYRIGRGEALQRRAHRLGLDIAQFVLRLVFGEIDAGPAGEQRERRLVIDKAAVVRVLGLRLGLVAADDNGRQGE